MRDAMESTTAWLRPLPYIRSFTSTFAAFAALALLVSSCGDGSPSGISEIGPSHYSLVVQPGDVSLEVGSSVQLSADLQDKKGIRSSPASKGLATQWVSDSPDVATIAEDGTLTAVKPGLAQIVAKVSRLSAQVSATIYVVPADVQLLNQSALVGVAGSSLPDRVNFKVLDENGKPAPGVPVTFTPEAGSGSVSPQTAVSNAGGQVSTQWTLGTKAGTQTLVASTDSTGGAVAVAGAPGNGNGKGTGPSKTVSADAKPGPAHEIVVTPSQAQVHPDSTVALVATVYDVFGNPIPDASIEWASSDPGIVLVDADGVATAESSGSATVSASVSGKTGTADFTVASAGSPTLSKTTGDFQTATAGATLPTHLQVRLTDGSGNPVEGTTVSWAVTAGGGTVSSPATATNVYGYTDVSWTLGPNPGDQYVIASVSGLGYVLFTATAVSDSAGAPASVDIQPSALTLQVDSTSQLTATVQDSSGTAIPGTTVTWTSSDPSIASVDSNGRVTGQAAGDATITAAADNVTGTVSVSVTASDTTAVTPGQVTDLAVVATSDSSVTLSWTQVGDGAGQPADYALRYGSPTISWGSAYSTEVSLQGTSIGGPMQYTYTGLSAGTDYEFKLVSYRGTLNVDATFGPASNTVAATTDAAVSSGDTTTVVASLTLSSSSLSFTALGDTLPLSVTAKDSAGTVLSGIGMTWRSTNTGVATVTSGGKVISKGTGTALIIAAATCCQVADTATVDVSQVVDAVSVSPASANLSVGGTRSLAATAVDRNGYDIPGRTFTWASSSDAVATVSTSGSVTAIAAGDATVSAAVDGKSGASAISVGDSSTPVTGLLFSDDFEAGSRSSPLWTSSSANVTVSSTRAKTGTYSLEFLYHAKPDGKDATAEQNFDLGGQYQELWFQYDLYVPSNFYHRTQSSGGVNNKFFRIWDENYNGFDVKGGVSFNPAGSGDSYGYLQWGDYNSVLYSGQNGTFPLFGTGGITRGTWAQIRLHFKLASSNGAGDGAIEMFVNGTRVLAHTGIDWHAADGANNYFRHGYLMGWANSGYDEDTAFYIDNLKVYGSDPGW